MAPRKKNRARGSKSKKQSGSSSAAVESPPPDPLVTTPELHSEAATSQQSPPSTTLEAATPARPPSISRLRPLSEGAQDTTSDLADEAATSRPGSPPTQETPPSLAGANPAPPPAPSSHLLPPSQEERDIFQLACHTAGGVTAAARYLAMMKLRDAENSLLLEQGLGYLAEAIPDITSAIMAIQDLADMKGDEEVVNATIGACEDTEKIRQIYDVTRKLLKKRLEQDHGGSSSDCKEEEGSSSSSGGGRGGSGKGGGAVSGVTTT